MRILGVVYSLARMSGSKLPLILKEGYWPTPDLLMVFENGYIESFNGRLRDECLNGEVFFSLTDARKSSSVGGRTTTGNHHTAWVETTVSSSVANRLCRRLLDRLENQLECDLHDARVAGAGYLAEVIVPHCRIWVVELRVIQCVKCFGPELQLKPFLNHERAVH